MSYLKHSPSKSNGAPASDAKTDSPAFNLKMLLEYSDPTRGIPPETHRAGIAGRALLLTKWLFRATCKPLINELFGRQRLFNRYLTDSYAQMAAELQKLREQVEALTDNKPKTFGPRGTAPSRRAKPTTDKS